MEPLGFFYNAREFRSCAVHPHQLLKLGKGLPRQLRLFHKTFVGMRDVTEGHALHSQSLVQIGIRLQDGNVDKDGLGVGGCRLVEYRPEGVAQLQRGKNA